MKLTLTTAEAKKVIPVLLNNALNFRVKITKAPNSNVKMTVDEDAEEVAQLLAEQLEFRH